MSVTVDYQIQTHVVGWPEIGLLQVMQQTGWSVPPYSTDLNAAVKVIPALKAKPRQVYRRFSREMRHEDIPDPMTICRAALRAVGHLP